MRARIHNEHKGDGNKKTKGPTCHESVKKVIGSGETKRKSGDGQ